MRVIYDSEINVAMWSCDDYSVKVITYITEHRLFGIA